MTDSSKPKRRWYQYSLRSLFVLVTLCAIPCSWYAVEMYKASQRRAAVEKILKSGGMVFFYDPADSPSIGTPPGKFDWLRRYYGDEYLANPSTVMYMDSEAGDADLKHLEDLRTIEALGLGTMRIMGGIDIPGPPITDAGLIHLRNLTNVTELELAAARITGDGLAHLKGMNKLARLNLVDTQLTDDGLSNLSEMTSIEELYLGGTKITDTGLEHLQGMTRLRILDLTKTNVTDAGLVHLKNMASLEELHLDGTRVADDGLVYLKGLPKLNCVLLEGTRVTDSCVEYLKEITSLNIVDVSDTQVTDEGVRRLGKALPDCAIDY